MKKCLLLIFYAFLSISVLNAQSADEQAVAQAVERLRQVMIKPEQAMLEDIAADELMYIHSSGTVRDKTGFINEFMKGQTVFTAITISDQEIRISGNIALVRHHLLGDSFMKQIRGKIDIIIFLTWQKKKGKWKLLGRQAAKIPV